MPARLLIVADTHVPKRARELPAEVWQEVEAADVVMHAGDWVDERLLDECESRAHRLVGVWGNNDHGALRTRLPEVARVEIEGIRRRAGRKGAAHSTPTSTSSSSGTATSPGTAPPPPACGCSTQGLRPTGVASPTAPI
jgi:putative phosphoesterase